MTTKPTGLTWQASLLIFILLTVDSLHFVFARLLLPHLPPSTSVLYVLGIGAMQMFIYLLLQRRLDFGLLWQHWRFFAAIGFLVATSTSFNYIAVGYVDPGTAALLGQTSTIFALMLGLFWLKEQWTPAEMVGAAVAIVGTFIISFQPGNLLRIGSLLVLSGAAMYALHAALVKRFSGEMDFANFFFFRLLATTAFLLVFAAGRGQLTWVANGRIWLLLLLVGTVDVVISRVLYYLALRRLQMSYHAILLTLSPVMTIVWSLLLFGVWPSLQGLLGGTAVIIGVILVTQAKNRQRRKLAAR